MVDAVTPVHIQTSSFQSFNTEHYRFHIGVPFLAVLAIVKMTDAAGHFSYFNPLIQALRLFPLELHEFLENNNQRVC